MGTEGLVRVKPIPCSGPITPESTAHSERSGLALGLVFRFAFCWVTEEPQSAPLPPRRLPGVCKLPHGSCGGSWISPSRVCRGGQRNRLKLGPEAAERVVEGWAGGAGRKEIDLMTPLLADGFDVAQAAAGIECRSGGGVGWGVGVWGVWG